MDGTEFYVHERWQDTMSSDCVIRVGVVTIMASLCVQCLGVCIDRHLN